jgi:hypothetical protein
VNDLEALQEKINEYALDYDRKTFERHVAGEEKYGAGTWLGIDTVEHALDEVLDMGNYVKFTYIKLRLMQDGLKDLFEADKSIAHAQPGYDGVLNKMHQGGLPT